MILVWGSYICMGAGILILLTTAIGLMRFNNAYVQLHIAGITDMLGLPLFLLGIVLRYYHLSDYHTAIKTFFTIVLVYCCLPVSSYIIVKIAFFIKKVSLRK